MPGAHGSHGKRKSMRHGVQEENISKRRGKYGDEPAHVLSADTALFSLFILLLHISAFCFSIFVLAEVT